MSGISGAKTRINAQLLKQKTFVNIDVNNDSESPEIASPRFQYYVQQVKRKKDKLRNTLMSPKVSMEIQLVPP